MFNKKKRIFLRKKSDLMRDYFVGSMILTTIGYIFYKYN